jgi:hypothetical protein
VFLFQTQADSWGLYAHSKFAPSKRKIKEFKLLMTLYIADIALALAGIAFT